MVEDTPEEQLRGRYKAVKNHLENCLALDVYLPLPAALAGNSPYNCAMCKAYRLAAVPSVQDRSCNRCTWVIVKGKPCYNQRSYGDLEEAADDYEDLARSLFGSDSRRDIEQLRDSAKTFLAALEKRIDDVDDLIQNLGSDE